MAAKGFQLPIGRLVDFDLSNHRTTSLSANTPGREVQIFKLCSFHDVH